MKEIELEPITTMTDLFRKCYLVLSAEVRKGDYYFSDGSFNPKIDQICAVISNLFTDERGTISGIGDKPGVLTYIYRKKLETYKPLKFVEECNLRHRATQLGYSTEEEIITALKQHSKMVEAMK